MKKVILAAAACSALSLLPVCGYGQRLGAPAADAKMLPGGAPASGGVGSLYSPSPYDGSANISIPIFQYSVEGSDFGVSFNYNTKGVPVDEVASDAGLHFSINAGASVSRTVRDLPDEISLVDGDTALYLSYGELFMQPIPGYTPPFDTVSVNKYWGFKGKYATYTESSASAADKRIYRDREADEFTVSLGSGSFSFYLGKDGTFFTHPNRRVKIEPLLNGLPFTTVGDLQVIGATSIVSPPVMTFRITDEQGNKYLFAPGDDETRDVQDCLGKGQFVTAYKFITRWVISQVTLADGHTIDYTYRSNTAGRLPVSMSYSLREGSGIWETPGSGSEVLSTLLSRKLESIRYPNNTTVYFDYDNSRKRRDYHYGALRQVRVSSQVNCLRYILQQSFFYADALTPEKTYTQGTTTGPELELKYRLKLNGLLLGSCDSTVIEPLYSFGYESLGLPPRLDCKQDFFGYYNDKAYDPLGNSVEDLVPRGTPNHYPWTGPYGDPTGFGGYTHGQDRSVDPAKARAGLLNKITNATGGSARFFYGGHVLSNVLTHVPDYVLYFGKDANDGLRVDSIIESEPFHYGDDRITIFQYSGGQRFLNGGYFHYQHRMDSMHVNQGIPVYLESIIMTNNYMTPHHLVNGANHGYSQVTITTRGIFGQQLSRKVVQFSNFKDGSDAAKYFIQGGGKDFFTYPYSDKQYLLDWKMGLPLEITEYDPKDRIVLKTTNRYGYTIDTTSAIGKVENRKTALVPMLGSAEPGIRWTSQNREITDDYRPYTGKALLQSTTIRKYVSDNNYIYDSTAYAYDYRDNLDYIISRNSKGAFIKTDQVYNYDMPGPGTAFDMSAARLEKLTGTERWLLGSGGNPDRLLDATINSYTFSGGVLQPQNLYQLRTSTPLTYSTLTGYSGGGTPGHFHGYMNAAYNGNAIDYFSKISEVTQRDANGNPLETYMPATGQYKAMIWDLNNNRKLAEAGSCRYEDIAYSSFEEVVPPFPPTAFRGNMEYSNLGVQLYTVLGERAPTGSMVYRLHSGILPTSLATAMPLQPDKTYILSFWYTSTGSLAAMPHVDIAGTNQPFTSNDEIATRGSWKQYQLRITPATTGPVTITAGSSTDILIDEVRLFPLGALMESQCGEPLFGPTSTTDGSSRITYYEYDQLGRQSVVRDQDGNIRSRTKNVVRGSD